MSTTKAQNEIEHGKFLAEHGAEDIWGWGSPAGQLRAKRRGELLATHGRLTKDSNVLEVGCGSGLFTEMMAQTGAHIVAVDISSELIDLAQKKGLPTDQVEFIVKRFEDTGDYGPFDAVVGSSVLHHLDYRESIQKIYELLKPGGRFVFAEPNMVNPQIAVQKNIPFIKKWLGDSPDETAFVRWRLAKLLQEIGFTEIDVQPYDFLHPYTPKPMIGLVRRTGLVVEKIPLLREIAGSLIITATK